MGQTGPAHFGLQLEWAVPTRFLAIVRGERLILERERVTSLYISRFSDRRFLSGQKAKLIYAIRATRGHQFCGVSTTPRGRGLLILGLFFG